MAKQMPKYMVEKIRRMNRLMAEIIDLNEELENWMEKNGIDYGFDFTFGHRDDSGYGILDVDWFVQCVNDAIN